MGDELLPILTRFHREIILPDMQRLIGDLRMEMNAKFDEVHGHFDAVCQRFDRLELKARVDGLQEQVRTLEARLDE